MNTKTPLTVQSLSIKNFLGIKELEFSPDGKYNFITGRNGAGKTSVLRAIQFAFEGKERGKNNLDYIHNGSDQAEILIDLGELRVRRTINGARTTLDVMNGDFLLQNPASALKEMIGRFSFNPIEFAFCDEKERTQVVLNALGVQYEVKDAKADGIAGKENPEDLEGLGLLEYLEKSHYDERTDVSRVLDRAKKTRQELQESLPENFKPFDQEAYDELLADIHKSEVREDSLNGQARDIRDEVEQERELIEGYKKEISKFNFVEITVKDTFDKGLKIAAEAEVQRDAEREVLAELKKQEVEMREALKSFGIQTQIKDYDERIPNGEELVKDLTDKIEKIRKVIKPRLVSEADLGIKGLTFEEGRFLINGVSVEDLSDSEKLRVGVKIAEKTTGELDFIFIDGVERLDPETLDEFVKEISASRFQYFFTTCHPTNTSGKTVKL